MATVPAETAAWVAMAFLLRWRTESDLRIRFLKIDFLLAPLYAKSRTAAMA